MKTIQEYEDYTRERITSLRQQKGISEYKLSYDLGHSKSYINNITSGKTLPSMSEFFYICNYFNISPKEFFDDKVSNPALISLITEKLVHLSDDNLLFILELLNRLKD
ncbi:helix-turn-helix domain-containing protein [Floccifex sp.]|uniref:helix-turn-helix domain-containing protein n=1 Tax=Floccifex sp. TaxID=2815810 RepID=UPI003F09DC3C